MRHSFDWFGRSTLFAAVLATACAAPPLYEPALSHVEIPVDAEGGAHMELLVSLRAVPADRARHLRAGMEARIRLDNETDLPARLDPREIELIARDLSPFPARIVSPESPLEVSPGDSAVVTARFDYPPGEGVRAEGLRAVELRWTVARAGRAFTNDLMFDRVEAAPRLSDPWFWEPAPRVVLRGELVRRR